MRAIVDVELRRSYSSYGPARLDQKPDVVHSDSVLDTFLTSAGSRIVEEVASSEILVR